jgi:ParB family chromosome partitioning protein
MRLRRSSIQALGRGLEALIPTSSASAESPAITELSIDILEPNPEQPRIRFDPDALAELADSVREHGLLQPLLVSRAPATQAGNVGRQRYVIIAGERRWHAARAAGLERVPVVVVETTPKQALVLALVENLQRADLHPLEAAQAYQRLLEYGLTQEEVARQVGKSRPAVANALRLLSLDPDTKEALLAGSITEGHARALQSAPADQRSAYLHQVLTRRLTVRQSEEFVRRGLPQAKQHASLSPELQAAEEQLRQAFGTRVELQKSRKGGRVVIHFYSEEELASLLELLTVAQVEAVFS